MQLPDEHRVNIQETKTQCISVFSENHSTGNRYFIKSSYYSYLGNLLSEGKIIQRADIQPVNSSVYMSLKRFVGLVEISIDLYTDIRYNKQRRPNIQLDI